MKERDQFEVVSFFIAILQDLQHSQSDCCGTTFRTTSGSPPSSTPPHDLWVYEGLPSHYLALRVCDIWDV